MERDFVVQLIQKFHQDKLGEVEASFVGLDDLLALKRAASRTKDLLDIKYLEALRDKK